MPASGRGSGQLACLDCGVLGDDERKESGEGGVEFGAAEAINAPWAFVSLLYQAGCAKDREVMAACRLADGNVDPPAGARPVGLPGQFAHDRASYRVLQRLERRLKGHVFGVDVHEASRARCQSRPTSTVRWLSYTHVIDHYRTV